MKINPTKIQQTKIKQKSNSYKLLNRYPKVSVSAKVSAICGIGSIGIGEYSGIGTNFYIGAALVIATYAASIPNR